MHTCKTCPGRPSRVLNADHQTACFVFLLLVRTWSKLAGSQPGPSILVQQLVQTSWSKPLNSRSMRFGVFYKCFPNAELYRRRLQPSFATITTVIVARLAFPPPSQLHRLAMIAVTTFCMFSFLGNPAWRLAASLPGGSGEAPWFGL